MHRAALATTTGNSGFQNQVLREGEGWSQRNCFELDSPKAEVTCRRFKEIQPTWRDPSQVLGGAACSLSGSLSSSVPLAEMFFPLSLTLQ